MAKARVIRQIGYTPGNTGSPMRYIDIEDIDEVRTVNDSKHEHNGRTQITLTGGTDARSQRVRYSAEPLAEIQRAIKEAKEL